MKHNDWLLADMCPQAANHCALFLSFRLLKFYNLEAWKFCCTPYPLMQDIHLTLIGSYDFFSRQLEAIIRISESLAKMRLKPFASDQDVDEALRLFQVSTLDAAMSGNLAGKNEIRFSVSVS